MIIILELNKIYHGDCLEFIRNIPDKSVDLIVADPPYNIGKDYKNDSDKMNKDDYIALLKQWVKEYQRILKDSGTLFIYTGKQFNSYYRIEIEKCMTVQNDIIWAYDSSGVQSKGKYGSLYEPIIFATKHSKNYTFNKEFATVDAKTGSKRKLIDYRKNPPQPYNTTKIDGDVWSYTRVRYRMPEYVNHPTQKPLSICERIINVHSNENDLILVPFAGSGSECVSAIMNNRNFIGFELNEEYIEVANNRISSHINQL